MPEPNSKPKQLTAFERIRVIRELARDGYGYEDIAILVGLPKATVRPFVIRERVK